MVNNNSFIFIACRPSGIIAILFWLCVALLLSGDASAANLIQNGGFENGDLTGWTHYAGGVNGASAYNGSYGYYYSIDNYFNNPFYDMYIEGISQTINLTNVDEITFYYSMPSYSVPGGVAGHRVWLDSDTSIWNDNTFSTFSYAYASADVSGYSGSHEVHFGSFISTGTPSTVVYTARYDDIIADAIPPPSITSYSNSITNDESTTINGEIGVDITFNITTDQLITTYNWYKDDVNQNNNNDELTTSFSSGNHTLTVNGTNANGTSNTITWNIINPNTISIEFLATQNSNPYSTFINDADSTGGFTDNNGYITLTPTIASSYPLDVQADLENGIKLTIVSADSIPSMPITFVGLDTSNEYKLYLDGTLISTFDASSSYYYYDIITHSTLSTIEFVKVTSGGGGTDEGEDETEEEEDKDTGIIIIDDIIKMELDEELIEDIILTEPIKTVTTFIKEPVNWLILLGAYIGILIGTLLTSKVNIPTILLYGTITWIIVLILTALGLNLFLLNYIFSSTSVLLATLNYIIYGVLVSLVISK